MRSLTVGKEKMTNIFNTAINAAKVPLFEVALPLVIGAGVVAVGKVLVNKIKK